MNKPPASSWWIPAIVAAAAVLVRLPFLFHADTFFNSDEAIEGLMARHINSSWHTWPVFFWGQGYKGVPEVYLVRALSFAAGFGVLQLKLVTLVVWTAGVALTARLGQRWYGAAAALLAGGFLAAGPPSVIYWSLCANAEVAWMTMLTAIVLLASQRMIDEPGRRAPAVVFVAMGAMIWIHPIGVCAIAGIASVAAARSRWWRAHGWRGILGVWAGRDVPPLLRWPVVALHALLAFVAIAFVWTYAGGTIHAGSVTAAHPQKVFRSLVVLTGIVAAAHAWFGSFVPRARLVRAVAWFTVGVSPILVSIARGHMPGAAILNHGLTEIPALTAALFRSALPMVVGMHDPVSQPVLPWWLVWGFPLAIVLHLAARRHRGVDRGATFSRDVALWIAVAVLVMLFPGGAFQDVHSYRYLMQFSGLAALSAASGVIWLWGRARPAAIALVALCAVTAIVADARWYARLWSDSSYARVTACLADQGITTATAEYWTAYTMTFLSDERLIVAPDDGDRYPPYQAAVAAAPRSARIVFLPTQPRPSGPVLCETPILVAVAR